MQTRLEQARTAAAYFIDNVATGSYVGIVEFQTSPQVVEYMIQLNSLSDRDSLKSSLPSVASGSTGIGAGLLEGIQVQNKNM